MPYKDPAKAKEYARRHYLKNRGLYQTRARGSDKRNRKEREKRWRQGLVFCKKHPSRKCLHGKYVNRGQRRCWECDKTMKDGSIRPAYLRYQQSQKCKEQKYWYKLSWRKWLKIQENKI